MDRISKAQCIFFDADDTLFGLNGSLGSLYAEVCNRFDIHISSHEIDRRVPQTWDGFRHEYRNTANEFKTSPEREKSIWLQFIGELLNPILDKPLPPATQEAIYREFALGRSRTLKPGILELLELLEKKGKTLGVVSNNDDRIVQVIDELGLSPFFEYVIPTSSIGYKKPSSRCFQYVQTLVGVGPQEMLYIGDHPELDYAAAIASGWSALLYNDRNKDVDIGTDDQYSCHLTLSEAVARPG